jgi:hypothetical protein
MQTVKNVVVTGIAYAVTILLFPLLLAANFVWQRHERKIFNAANCADYLNTEYKTKYTTEQIDAAYKAALAYLRDKAWIDRIESEIVK